MSKKLVFDLGGVLYSNGTRIAYNRLLRHGINEDIIKYSLLSEDSWNLRRGKITSEQYWNIIKEKDSDNWKTIFNTWHNSYTLNLKMFRYIEYLNSKNLNLSVWSDTTESRYNFLKSTFLYPNFSNEVLSFIEGSVKTDLDFTDTLVNKLESNPNDIILIDDSIEETSYAKDLGINVINFNGKLDDLIYDINRINPTPNIIFDFSKSKNNWKENTKYEEESLKIKFKILLNDINQRFKKISSDKWLIEFNKTLKDYSEIIIKERKILKKGFCTIEEYEKIRPHLIMSPILTKLFTIRNYVSVEEIKEEILLIGIVAGIDNDLFSEDKDSDDLSFHNILYIFRENNNNKEKLLEDVINYRNNILKKILDKRNSYKNKNIKLYNLLRSILLFAEGNFLYLQNSKRWNKSNKYKKTYDINKKIVENKNNIYIYYPNLNFNINNKNIDKFLNKKSLNWCNTLASNKFIDNILRNVNSGLATKYLYSELLNNEEITQLGSDLILFLFIIDDYLENCSDENHDWFLNLFR